MEDRFVAIGDIHGCAAELRLLIERIDPNPEDHLVFLGDYVDRGPDSSAVIDLLLELEQQYSCTFLRGNHEEMMLAALRTGEPSYRDLWYENGGQATIWSYSVAGTGHAMIPPVHLSFLRATEYLFETDEYLFVHAGLNPDLTVAENLVESDPNVFLWERRHLQPGIILPWEKTVVCGHTIVAEPVIRRNLIAIDTGAFLGYRRGMRGRLTAIRLPEREVISVFHEEAIALRGT